MKKERYLKEIFSYFLPEIEEETRFIIRNRAEVGSQRIFRALSFVAKSPNGNWSVAIQAEATSTPLQYKAGKLGTDNVILVKCGQMLQKWSIGMLVSGKGCSK